jgi:hypothetical protein
MSAIRSTSFRTPRLGRGAALLVVAGLAFVTALLPASALATQSPTHLAEHGWECGQTPPFVQPPRIVCAPPGLGRPFPGSADRPTYRLLLFSLDGDLVARVHFIRGDLYAGQPCNGGNPYVFSQFLGHYECLNPAN